jgi:hypothetical protein
MHRRIAHQRKIALSTVTASALVVSILTFSHNCQSQDFTKCIRTIARRQGTTVVNKLRVKTVPEQTCPKGFRKLIDSREIAMALGDAVGATGPQGTSGAKGDTGSHGAIGNTGAKGDTGDAGLGSLAFMGKTQRLPLGEGAESYFLINGLTPDFGYNTAEEASLLIPSDCAVENFSIHLPNGGPNKEYTFNMRVNDTETLVSCSIPSADGMTPFPLDRTCSSTGQGLTLQSQDLVSIRVVSSGPTGSIASRANFSIRCNVVPEQ